MSVIRTEVEDRIATITIDRPDKRGAMTYAILRDFYAAIAAAGEDGSVRAVVLTGTPGSFCAGTDLADLQSTPEEQRGSAGSGTAPRPSSPWPLVACPKPVIAAVDGPAVGMGAEFALQCDVRIATTRARFAWNFVHRGLVSDTGAGSFLLPRIVGVTQAARILLSGAFVEPAEALALGLVSEVVEPDDLAVVARAEARRYLDGSPFAVARSKRLLYEGMAGGLDEHMARTSKLLQECFHSEDHREGVASFLERRPANFTGR